MSSSDLAVTERTALATSNEVPVHVVARGRGYRVVRDDDERPVERPGKLRLRLLRSFMLHSDGRPVELPLSVQRLVCFLSLHDHPLHRHHVAGTLWPETTDQRAAANLRSALWRLNQLKSPVVVTAGPSLAIGPEVAVDLAWATARAHLVLGPDEVDAAVVDPAEFCFDLLPDWYDDWVVVEREQFRQLRLRALERLCARLTVREQYGAAAEAAMAAIAGEPLRESAHRALSSVHLAEGNRAEAVRQYHFYDRLLRAELGFEPSSQFRALVGIA